MRACLRITFFLTLGAVLTVVIAGSLALSIDVGKAQFDEVAARPHPREPATTIVVSVRLRIGARWISFHNITDELPGDLRTRGRNPQDLVPQWARSALRRTAAASAQGNDRFDINSYGFPFLAMGYVYHVDLQGNDVRGGVRVSNSSFRDGPVAVPCTPLLIGFVADSLLYAGAMWVCTMIGVASRRALRRARGVCVRCGYDLQENELGGCPECGWGRQKGDYDQ